jgi:hypothetical protein
MGKNWKAICALSNKNLQFAFAQTKESDPLLEQLRKGFPECFTDGLDKGPVPWSTLKQLQFELDGTSRGIDTHVLQEVGIPYQIYADVPGHSMNSDWKTFPKEISNQPHSTGRVVRMQNGNFLVVDKWKDSGDIKCITVVPLERVDLNA